VYIVFVLCVTDAYIKRLLMRSGSTMSQGQSQGQIGDQELDNLFKSIPRVWLALCERRRPGSAYIKRAPLTYAPPPTVSNMGEIIDSATKTNDPLLFAMPAYFQSHSERYRQYCYGLDMGSIIDKVCDDRHRANDRAAARAAAAVPSGQHAAASGAAAAGRAAAVSPAAAAAAGRAAAGRAAAVSPAAAAAAGGRSPSRVDAPVPPETAGAAAEYHPPRPATRKTGGTSGVYERAIEDLIVSIAQRGKERLTPRDFNGRAAALRQFIYDQTSERGDLIFEFRKKLQTDAVFDVRLEEFLKAAMYRDTQFKTFYGLLDAVCEDIRKSREPLLVPDADPAPSSAFCIDLAASDDDADAEATVAVVHENLRDNILRRIELVRDAIDKSDPGNMPAIMDEMQGHADRGEYGALEGCIMKHMSGLKAGVVEAYENLTEFVMSIADEHYQKRKSRQLPKRISVAKEKAEKLVSDVYKYAWKRVAKTGINPRSSIEKYMQDEGRKFVDFYTKRRGELHATDNYTMTEREASDFKEAIRRSMLYVQVLLCSTQNELSMVTNFLHRYENPSLRKPYLSIISSPHRWWCDALKPQIGDMVRDFLTSAVEVDPHLLDDARFSYAESNELIDAKAERDTLLVSIDQGSRKLMQLVSHGSFPHLSQTNSRSVRRNSNLPYLNNSKQSGELWNKFLHPGDTDLVAYAKTCVGEALRGLNTPAQAYIHGLMQQLTKAWSMNARMKSLMEVYAVERLIAVLYISIFNTSENMVTQMPSDQLDVVTAKAYFDVNEELVNQQYIQGLAEDDTPDGQDAKDSLHAVIQVAMDNLNVQIACSVAFNRLGEKLRKLIVSECMVKRKRPTHDATIQREEEGMLEEKVLVKKDEGGIRFEPGIDAASGEPRFISLLFGAFQPSAAELTSIVETVQGNGLTVSSVELGAKLSPAELAALNNACDVPIIEAPPTASVKPRQVREVEDDDEDDSNYARFRALVIGLGIDPRTGELRSRSEAETDLQARMLDLRPEDRSFLLEQFQNNEELQLDLLVRNETYLIFSRPMIDALLELGVHPCTGAIDANKSVAAVQQALRKRESNPEQKRVNGQLRASIDNPDSDLPAARLIYHRTPISKNLQTVLDDLRVDPNTDRLKHRVTESDVVNRIKQWGQWSSSNQTEGVAYLNPSNEVWRDNKTSKRYVLRDALINMQTTNLTLTACRHLLADLEVQNVLRLALGLNEDNEVPVHELRKNLQRMAQSDKNRELVLQAIKDGDITNTDILKLHAVLQVPASVDAKSDDDDADDDSDLDVPLDQRVQHEHNSDDDDNADDDSDDDSDDDVPLRLQMQQEHLFTKKRRNESASIATGATKLYSR
jgi:hypothetical protein